MKCRLRNFNSLNDTLFQSSFVRKRYFTVKIFIMHITSMGLNCKYVYAEAHLEPSRKSFKLRKSFIVDVQMGSKYASGITFTAETVYGMSILFLHSQRQLMLYCKLLTILAHLMLSLHIVFFISFLTFQLFRTEIAIMSIKHAKFSLLYCHFWWQRFFLLVYSQFCCKIGKERNRQLWGKKFIKLVKIK